MERSFFAKIRSRCSAALPKTSPPFPSLQPRKIYKHPLYLTSAGVRLVPLTEARKTIRSIFVVPAVQVWPAFLIEPHVFMCQSLIKL